VYDGMIACHVGRMVKGDEGQVTVTLRVDEDASAGTSVEFKVTAVTQKPGHKPNFLSQASAWTTIVIPQLTLTKRSSADIVYEGQSVTYTYVLTNDGDVCLKDVTLTDDQKQPPQVCEPVSRLEPGETFTCTWTATLEADTTNVARATGLDPWGDPVTDTASVFVNVVQPPGEGGSGIITLEKVASEEVIDAGDTVGYTYTVANPGQDPVHDITLTDDKLGTIAGPFDLQAGESVTFEASAVLMTDTTNVATAEGYDLLGNAVTATDSASVRVAVPDVALSLVLTASAPRVYVGEVVTYTYVVSNVGSDVAYDVVLRDDVAATIAGPFNLDGGQRATYTASRALDKDTTVVATVTGVDRLGKSLEATDDVFVDTIQRPGPDGGGILVLTVTPSATSVEAGTVVTYTYVVTNVSQDLVCQVVVQDDKFSYIIGFHPLPGGAAIQDAPYSFCLQAGESQVATFPIPLEETITNTAVATGLDLLMSEVSSKATAFVQVYAVEPPKDHIVFFPLVFKNGP
jgi:uncharacterized repeat protein (TIGR01451 family)